MRRRPLLAVPTALATLALVFGGITAANADDGSTPTITGTVYSTTGAPLSGIDVEIIHPGSSNDSDPWPNGTTDAETNASGQYTISGYPAFSGTLEFYDTNHVYATAYLGGAQFADNATPVDDTTVDSLQVPDMTLQPGGWIESDVTRPDGTQATDLTLAVYAQNSSGDWQLTMQDQISLPTQPGVGGGSWAPWYKYGNLWQTPALLPGNYRICVWSSWGEPQCEGDTASPGTSTPLAVTANMNTEADFALQAGGEIDGTVVTAPGANVPAASYLDESWLNPDTATWEDLGLVSVFNGKWGVTHLRPGEYQFALPPGEPETVYYPDASTLDAAGTVDVVDGQSNPSVMIVQGDLPTAVATQTSLTLSASDAAYGSSNVIVTADVSAAGQPLPDGSVTIEDFGPNGGVFTEPLVDGSVSIALPADLDVGTHGIEAYYQGNQTEGYTASNSDRLTLTVGALPVDVNVSVTPGIVAYGGSSTVTAQATATVEGSTTIPVGAVSFDIDGVPYGPGSYLPINPATGTVSLSLPGLVPGEHSITAVFDPEPDDDFAQAVSTGASLVVTRGAARLAATAAVEKTAMRRLAVLTVSVTAPGSHPAGTILVYSGSRLVGRATLVRHGDFGIAVLKWSKPSSRAASYTVRFVSASGGSGIMKLVSVR